MVVKQYQQMNVSRRKSEKNDFLVKFILAVL